MSETKLLPCPFCGSSKVELFYFKVFCRECGASTEDGLPQDEAIEEWNTRKPMDKIVERIMNDFICDGCSGYTNCFELDRKHECGTYKALERIVKAGGIDD